VASESARLTAARRHLRRVELAFEAADAERELQASLDLLEVIVAAEDPARDRSSNNSKRALQTERETAARLGVTYVDRFAARIGTALEARDVPEPRLKHFLRLSQLLARSEFADRSATDLAALTVTIAERFLDALFEGYSPEEKEREIRRLTAQLCRGESD
jgi:hypothetical protein